MEEDPRCARLMGQRRDQLMKDIDTIVEGNFKECAHWHKQKVVRMLCDAVVSAFPSGTVDDAHDWISGKTGGGRDD